MGCVFQQLDLDGRLEAVVSAQMLMLAHTAQE